MRFLLYISPIWEGDDSKASGKRILGIISFLVGVGLSIQAFYGDCSCIPNKVLIIGGLLGAGMTFFGITSFQSYMTTKLEKSNEDATTK